MWGSGQDGLLASELFAPRRRTITHLDQEQSDLGPEGRLLRVLGSLSLDEITALRNREWWNADPGHGALDQNGPELLGRSLGCSRICGTGAGKAFGLGVTI